MPKKSNSQGRINYMKPRVYFPGGHPSSSLNTGTSHLRLQPGKKGVSQKDTDAFIKQLSKKMKIQGAKRDRLR